MNQTVQKIDMLNGPLAKKILLFTLPIALGSMLQQLFNAADTSIVGYFDSANSLAAVGTNGEIIAFIVSLSSGLSIGVNVLIASQIGQKKLRPISEIVYTSILLAGIIGILGMIIGQWAARPLLILIRTPDTILSSAELYLRIYFLGYPFLLIYDFGSAILRARGDSRYPSTVLIISGFINVMLNLFFVIILHIGVAGVSTATVLSTFFSSFLIIRRLKKDTTEFHLSFKNSTFHFNYLVQILKIGVPSAIQGAVFCFANIFVQASVNYFGAFAIAGSTIAMNFEYFAYYVITAFGQTATTFVSQNHAANEEKRCQKILWLCLTFSILSSLILIEPVILFHNKACGLFSAEPAVIQNACLRISCILFFEPICSLYEIPAGVLRGSGHSLLPAVMTIFGTCIFRIVWISTIFRQYHSLKLLYFAFPLSWVLTILLIVLNFIILKPLKTRH